MLRRLTLATGFHRSEAKNLAARQQILRFAQDDKPAPHCARQRNQWSASVIATIASPMTTNRGSRHGSCRPFTAISVASPLRVTVGCGRGMLLVGLTATRMTIGSPLEMPP